MCEFSFVPNCPRRSMDRTQACGACDVGSIPTEGTDANKSTPCGCFCLYLFARGRNRTEGPPFWRREYPRVATKWMVSTARRGDSYRGHSVKKNSACALFFSCARRSDVSLPSEIASRVRKRILGAFARPERDGARWGSEIFQQKNIRDREHLANELYPAKSVSDS